MGRFAWVGLLLLLCQLSAKVAEGVENWRHIDVLNGDPWSADDALLDQSSTFFGGTSMDEESERDGEAKNGSKQNYKYANVTEAFLTQRLNHFAPSEEHAFLQRYFFSSRFVDPSSSKEKEQYAFLCCGGEGPALDRSVLVDSVHCTGDMVELASILHNEHGRSVYLFALEHRYYGKSYPSFVDENNTSVSPVTNENLVYLSSRQALGDLAHFVNYMTEKLGATTKNTHKSSSRGIRGETTTTITTTNTTASSSHDSVGKGMVPAGTKWVTFGGSYPGMLAGWARLKFPHLIHAAVSNSAPIQVTLDMVSYNDKLAFDLQYDLIGGSDECLQIFQRGHEELVEALEKDDEAMRNEIAGQFNLCDASDLLYEDNVRNFLGDGVLPVGGLAQENDPACQGRLCNIEKLCSHAKKLKRNNYQKASWEILATMARERYGGRCRDVDWNKTLDAYAQDNVKTGGWRSWVWQTCTEFGFFQTCEQHSLCPFGKGYHTLEQDFEICSYAFGVSKTEVRESIQQTLEYFGDKELVGGSRIVSVNGDVDPWSTLARIDATERDTSLPTYNAKKASHHFWTHEVKATDDPEITKARAYIYNTVMDWLLLERDNNDYEEEQLGSSNKAARLCA